MTLTIHLSPEQEVTLKAKAMEQGVTAEAFASRVLQHELAGRRRHISEVIRDNMKDVPPEDLATLPNDGATQHDYYIYGLPKREQ